MNAVGAALQQNDEVADYAILSSYLGPVVSRPSSETRAFGTLRENIEAACASASPEEILSRPRWIIPLCGGKRMFLPNFAYAELVKMVQTIMLRQKILMMQKFQEGHEKDSAAGYSFTYDPSPLADDHHHTAFSRLTTQQLNGVVEVAYREAAQICKQILRIRVPILANGKTFTLTPLRAPRLSSNHQQQAPDDHDDTDLDDLDDMADDNGDDEDISGVGRSQTAESAAREVTAYSALCDDLEEAVKDSQAVFSSGGTSSSSLPSSAPEVLLTHCATLDAIHVEATVVTSSFLDKDDVVSIPLMLKARLDCQSKATVHSERVVLLDPKFTVLRRTLNSLDPETKMTHQEASQRLAILQKQDSSFAPVKTARELRWKQVSNAIARVIQPQELPNLATKNISSLFPLERGSYVIMHTAVRFYIGEVLDLYRKGANSRYGSIQSTTSVSALSFLSLRVYLPLETSAAASNADDTLYEDDTDVSPDAVPSFSRLPSRYQYEIHTHAPASGILYHIGKRALKGTNTRALELSNANARHWVVLTAPQVKQKLPRLKISGGRIMKA